MKTIYSMNVYKNTILDVVCLLFVGLGFAGMAVYVYALEHPLVTEIRPPAIIAPQDNTAGKLRQTNVNTIHEI